MEFIEKQILVKDETGREGKINVPVWEGKGEGREWELDVVTSSSFQMNMNVLSSTECPYSIPKQIGFKIHPFAYHNEIQTLVVTVRYSSVWL